MSIEEIRPYRDIEVNDAILRVIQEPAFHQILAFFFPQDKIPAILEMMKGIHTVFDLQDKLTKPIIHGIIQKSATSLTYDGIEKIQQGKGYLYISNHRDIVLDPAFLSYTTHIQRGCTVEIAIGSNLLAYPWIVDVVKLNKSFIVKRSISGRELLINSGFLSEYIRQTLVDREHSIWLAQREGRAKDGNDRTQGAVIKMLSMHSRSRDLRESLKGYKIVPTSITYEYDPCDALKAREIKAHAEGIPYVKSEDEDVNSMALGMTGFKGKVHYHFGEILEPEKCIPEGDQQSQIDALCALIDKNIFLGYQHSVSSCAALHLINHPAKALHPLNKDLIDTFAQYCRSQAEKFYPAPEELLPFMYEQYARPLINKYEAGLMNVV